MTHTIESPLAQKIIAAGHDLHFKMTDGKAQWWVSNGTRVTAAPSLRDLAEALGVQEHDMSDLITTAEAAKLTGYSVSFINAQISKGAIPGRVRTQTKTGYVNSIPRAQVMAWLEKRKAAGKAPVGPTGPRRIATDVPSLSDPIDLKRAARISGYSINTIRRAMTAGEVSFARLSERNTRVSRAEIMKWAEEQRKKGGQHLPRIRKKAKKNVYKAPSSALLDVRGAVPGRLLRYVANTTGTPMEITAEEFVSRAVNQALDRLGVK